MAFLSFDELSFVKPTQSFHSKSWWVWDGMENSDLWYNCRYDNFSGSWLCASSKESGNYTYFLDLVHEKKTFLRISFFFVCLSEWLHAVQVLMVLSVVFSSVSFLIFLGQLFTMSKGGLFYFTGLCQVFAGKCARITYFFGQNRHPFRMLP